VHKYRTIRGNSGHKAPLHQINDHWGQAGFDNVATDTPDYWFAEIPRATHACRKLPQALHGENVWQTRKKNLKC